MRDLATLFARIESDEFAVNANLASDLRTFLRFVRDQPEVRTLREMLKSVETRIKLLGRVYSLASLEPDDRYENPYDTALATYQWVLALVDYELAYYAASVVRRVAQCWWAREISAHLLRSRLVSSDASSSHKTARALLEGKTSVVFEASNAGDVLSKSPSRFPGPGVRWFVVPVNATAPDRSYFEVVKAHGNSGAVRLRGLSFSNSASTLDQIGVPQ